MATRAELIYDIKEYLKKYSDDNDVSSRHIMYLYRNKRARNLRQLFSDGKKSFDASMIQTLCVELETVDSALCGDATGCKVIRSKVAIPALLDLRNRNTLLYVGPRVITGDSFEFVNSEQLPYIFDRPYSNGIFTFLDESGYIYIMSKSKSINFLECISVRAIFEDPEALEGFTSCCGECDDDTICFTDDTEYPLQPYLIEAIRAEIIKELVPREKLPEDNENNSDDN